MLLSDSKYKLLIKGEVCVVCSAPGTHHKLFGCSLLQSTSAVKYTPDSLDCSFWSSPPSSQIVNDLVMNSHNGQLQSSVIRCGCGFELEVPHRTDSQFILDWCM